MNVVETVAAHKLALAVVGSVLVAGAGGYVVFLSPSGSASSPALLDTVPADANVVVTAGGSAVTDETTRAVVEVALNASAVREPDSYEELVGLAGVGTGLDTDEFDRLIAYSAVETRATDLEGGDRGYVGVLVESEWSEGAFVAAIANETGTTRDTYEGYSVHVVGEGTNATWIGVIREGRYVVGTRPAVTDALDVAAGNADAFDGPVRSALADAGEGPVRFASVVPRAVLRENPKLNGSGLPVDFTAVKSVRLLAGSMQLREQNVSLQVRVRTNSTDNAETLVQQLDAFTSLRASMARSRAVATQLQAVRLQQDDRTVVVTYEGPRAKFVSAFRVLVDEPFGPLGGGFGASVPGSMKSPARVVVIR